MRSYLFLAFLLAHSPLIHSKDSRFRYDLTKLHSPKLDALITKCSTDLATDGFFLIPKFLSPKFAAELKHLALTDAKEHAVKRDVLKSIFGNQRDVANYEADHPRNLLGTLRMSFVGRSNLPAPMIDMYNYDPLTRFMEAILQRTVYDSFRTYQKPYPALHRSDDKEGSVYIFLGEDGDQGEWHVDQHPFTCIYMLSKPDHGGDFLLAHFPPTQKDAFGGFNWDWELFASIHMLYDHHPDVRHVSSEEGDVYCFEGNVSWHAAGPIMWTSQPRAIMAMAYADRAGFQHSKHVHELNAWGEHKHLQEKCLGGVECMEVSQSQDLSKDDL